MQNELPDSEVEANNYLNGFNLAGNWPPAALTAVAFACMRRGMDEAAYEALIRSHQLGAELESKEGRHNVGRLISKQWAFAEEKFEPPTGGADVSIRQRARDLLPRVLLADWPGGQPGIAQRVLAIALVARVAETGAYTFDCSARYAAVLAGMPDQAKASTALTAVAATGLVEFIEKTGASRRVKVNLRWEPEASKETTTNNLSTGKWLFVVESLLDVFTRRGLGPVAGWLYALLQDDELTKAELAGLLGLSKPTVKTGLDKLEDHGMVVVKDGGKYTAVPVDLIALAGALEVAGYRETLRKRFAVEQAANAQERKEWYAEKVRAEMEWNERYEATQAEWFASLCDAEGCVNPFCRGDDHFWLSTPTAPDPFEGVRPESHP